MLLHPGPRCVIQQFKRHYSRCITIWAYYVHYTPLIWSCDIAILRQILICMVAVSFKMCPRLHINSIFLLAQVSWNEYNSTAVASVTAKTLHSLPERGVSSLCITEAPICGVASRHPLSVHLLVRYYCFYLEHSGTSRIRVSPRQTTLWPICRSLAPDLKTDTNSEIVKVVNG